MIISRKNKHIVHSLGEILHQIGLEENFDTASWLLCIRALLSI